MVNRIELGPRDRLVVEEERIVHVGEEELELGEDDVRKARRVDHLSWRGRLRGRYWFDADRRPLRMIFVEERETFDWWLVEREDEEEDR